MKKAEREGVMREWRALLRPLLDSNQVTQEGVAARLAQVTGSPVDQSNVSKWLKDTTPQPAFMPAIIHMLKELREKSWPQDPGIPSAVGERTAPYNEAREETELARVGALPDSLLRTMERESIAAVIRAQGVRDACRAARIEAEKAPNRSLLADSSYGARAVRMTRAAGKRRRGEGQGSEGMEQDGRGSHPDT